MIYVVKIVEEEYLYEDGIWLVASSLVSAIHLIEKAPRENFAAHFYKIIPMMLDEDFYNNNTPNGYKEYYYEYDRKTNKLKNIRHIPDWYYTRRNNIFNIKKSLTTKNNNL